MLGAFATHALRDGSIEMLIAFGRCPLSMYHALALLIVAVAIGISALPLCRGRRLAFLRRRRAVLGKPLRARAQRHDRARGHHPHRRHAAHRRLGLSRCFRAAAIGRSKIAADDEPASASAAIASMISRVVSTQDFSTIEWTTSRASGEIDVLSGGGARLSRSSSTAPHFGRRRRCIEMSIERAVEGGNCTAPTPQSPAGSRPTRWRC